MTKRVYDFMVYNIGCYLKEYLSSSEKRKRAQGLIKLLGVDWIEELPSFFLVKPWNSVNFAAVKTYSVEWDNMFNFDWNIFYSWSTFLI